MSLDSHDRIVASASTDLPCSPLQALATYVLPSCRHGGALSAQDASLRRREKDPAVETHCTDSFAAFVRRYRDPTTTSVSLVSSQFCRFLPEPR